MASDEKQWASVRESFVYWANKRKANSVRSYASVREAIKALADNESRYNGGGGSGDLGGLFTIIYTTDAQQQEIIDYAIGNEVFLWSKDLKILTERAAELFNSTRYTDNPYVLRNGDIINVTALLRHLLLEDVTPEPEENEGEEEEEPTQVLRIRAFDVEGLYSDGFISARGVDNTASSGSSGIDEDDLWDILESVGNNEQINLAHLTNLQTWVSQNFYQRNGQDGLVTESDLLSNYTIWGQRFRIDSGNLLKKIITGDMSNVGHIHMSGNIYMNNDNIILGPSSNYLSANVGFYSTSFVSARGVDSTPATAGSDFDVDEMWEQLATNDSSHKIHNSHLNNDIVTTTVLNNTLSNYLDITGLQTELNNYTIWGQHFVNKTITGNMSNVGNISMNGNIDYVSNLYFNQAKSVYLVADNTSLKSNSGFYSLGFVSARGVDSSSASGGSFDVDEMWDALAEVDSSHKIDNSHLNSNIVTTSVLDSTLSNYLTILGLQTELNNYTVWGQHFDNNKAITGNMSYVGNISMIGNISYVGNLYFDSNSTIYLSAVSNSLRSTAGFYSNSFVSARGLDSSSPSSSSFDESDMWDLLENTTSGHYVNPYLIPIGSGLAIQSGRLVGTGGGGSTYTQGNGIDISVNNVISAVPKPDSGLSVDGSGIYLNQATSLLIGGVKLGDAAIRDISSAKTYGVGITNSGQLAVYVPWSSGEPILNNVTYSGTLVDGRVAIFDQTDGVIKSSGYTIAKSVPSTAVFTDTNYYHNRKFNAGLQITENSTGLYEIFVPLGDTGTSVCAGNDSRLSDSRPASDVYSWAKAATKPSYTASEVGAAASNHTHTTSLNNDDGPAIINLSANTKYKLTAGDTSIIFKTPEDTNTWPTVVNGGNTANWGSTVTVGSVGGTSLTFDMPANPVAANTLSAAPAVYSVLASENGSSYQFKNNPTIIKLILRNGTGTSQTNQQTAELSCNDSGLLYINKGASINGSTTIAGNVTLSSGGKFYDASDIRLKKDIKELVSVLESIEDIPVVQFEYKSNEGHKYIGTLAQKLLPLFPELLTQDENGYYAVDYGGLAAIAIGGLKELVKRVKYLEDKIYGD